MKADEPGIVISGRRWSASDFVRADGTPGPWMSKALEADPLSFEAELGRFLTEFFSPGAAVTVHTSGSTGVPKAFAAEKSRMRASARATIAFLGLKPGCTNLLAMPLRFIAGKMVVVRSVECGLNLIPVEPCANPFLEHREAVDLCALTPMQAATVLANPATSRFLLESRAVILGGGPVDEELTAKLQSAQGAVYASYGMTETLSHVALRRLNTLYWAHGHPKHHSNEDDGQIGCVLNSLYNRDPMSHGHINFTRCGLPIDVQKRIGEKFWGSPDTVDAIGDYTPTNIYKMKRLQWVVARKELHDMLGICSWTAPWEVSPLREKGYIGDIEMESKVFRAVTGIEMTQDDLDKAGLRAFILQRLYTMRQLKSRNPRQDHDQYPEWIFWDPKGKAPFTKGTIRMERSDIEKSFDLFYGLMDFDVKTGAPTEKSLKEYGLDFALSTMKQEGLM